MKRDTAFALLYFVTWFTVPAFVAHLCGDNPFVFWLLSLAWPLGMLLYAAFHPETLSVGPRR